MLLKWLLKMNGLYAAESTHGIYSQSFQTQGQKNTDIFQNFVCTTRTKNTITYCKETSWKDSHDQCICDKVRDDFRLYFVA